MGRGARPEEKDDKARSIPTRVKGKLKKGRIIIEGQTFGPQAKGRSVIEVQEAIKQSATAAPAEAVPRERVPREYMQHAKEYFEQLSGQE
jgi:hypothetical protein